MIILFTHRSWRNSRYEKIELITAISSLIVMNSFCCEERLLCVCVCVCVLSPGSFKSNRVCNRLSHHEPCCWADAHTQTVHAHKHTHTHLGLYSTAGCAMSYLAQRLCAAVGAAFAKSLHTMCNSRHTHPRRQRFNQNTHSHLATFYRAAHHPSNEWDARGTWVFLGGGEHWPTKLSVIGGAGSLITARLQLKVVHDSGHIFY